MRKLLINSLMVQPTDVLIQCAHTKETTANQRRIYVVMPTQRRFSVVSTLGARCVNIITREERGDRRKKRNRE